MNSQQLTRAGIRAMFITIAVFFACVLLAILSGMNGWQIALLALAFLVATICAAWVSVIALCQIEYEERHPNHDRAGDAQ